MRLFNRIKVFVLIGVAVLVLGVAGCSPGDVVWKVDGDASAMLPLPRGTVQ